MEFRGTFKIISAPKESQNNGYKSFRYKQRKESFEQNVGIELKLYLGKCIITDVFINIRKERLKICERNSHLMKLGKKTKK